MVLRSAPAIQVTGYGVLSSLGASSSPFLDAVFAGRTSIQPLPETGWKPRFRNGAPVTGFVPGDHFSDRDLTLVDRFTQFATVAAREAWAASGLPSQSVDPSRIAVVIGTANAGIDILDDGYRRILSNGGALNPMTIPQTMGNAPASRIAHEIGARGPVFGITSACASAAHAILTGASLIRGGLVDVAIVGGSDSCFSEGMLRAWNALRVVSPDTCRPFSVNRQGLILGEGAGVLVLEATGHAEARGAKSHGVYLGGGMGCDAGHLLAPDSAGMRDAMRSALLDAGLRPADIGYVNAHGTGTVANDRAEGVAIREVFGEGDHLVPVSSTKSMIGHTMGASGAIEAIVTLAALQRGSLPPTLNFAGIDPEIGFEPIPDVAIPSTATAALSNSFAFGGLNVALAFGRSGA